MSRGQEQDGRGSQTIRQRPSSEKLCSLAKSADKVAEIMHKSSSPGEGDTIWRKDHSRGNKQDLINSSQC